MAREQLSGQFEHLEHEVTHAESAIASSKSESEDVTFNNLPFYGVRREDLFLFEPDSRWLDWILRGTYNLHEPEEMRRLSNPDEILARLLAAGYFKRYPHTKEMKETDAIDLINRMNGFAYGLGIKRGGRAGRRGEGEESYYPLRKIQAGKNAIFPNRPGELMERLQTLDQEVLQTFLDSYNGPRILMVGEEAEIDTYSCCLIPRFTPRVTNPKEYVASILYMLDESFSIQIESKSRLGLEHTVYVNPEMQRRWQKYAPLSCTCEANQKSRMCSHIKEVFASINSKPVR